MNLYKSIYLTKKHNNHFYSTAFATTLTNWSESQGNASTSSSRFLHSWQAIFVYHSTKRNGISHTCDSHVYTTSSAQQHQNRNYPPTQNCNQNTNLKRHDPSSIPNMVLCCRCHYISHHGCRPHNPDLPRYPVLHNLNRVRRRTGSSHTPSKQREVCGLLIYSINLADLVRAGSRGIWLAVLLAECGPKRLTGFKSCAPKCVLGSAFFVDFSFGRNSEG